MEVDMKGRRLSDIVRYLTVRIKTGGPDGILTGTGTGFVFGLEHGGNSFPFLITNKHVVDGAFGAEITLHEGGADGRPIPGPGRSIRFTLAGMVIRHPADDVDLVAIPLAQLFNHAQAEGWTPFVEGLGPQTIPKPAVRKALAAIETVTMIGYPVGIADVANNAPIVRQGITATPVGSNYRGRREFLIDMAVFPGSSGSPVLIMNEGSWATPGGLAMGNRLMLLGVLFAGHTRTETGEIRQEVVPTQLVPTVAITQMVHLGICLHADQIIEMIDAAGFPELMGHPDLAGFDG